MSRSRVLIATDQMAELSSAEAGAALGRGFAAVADVAVVPMAVGGHAIAEAVAAITGADISGGPGAWAVRSDQVLVVGFEQEAAGAWVPDASTAEVGSWIAQALAAGDARTVVLDLTGITAHDGGAGLLAAAADVLTGRELLAVVDGDEVDLVATGLTGAVARRGYGAGADVAEVLAADTRMVRYAQGLGPGLATMAGGGAAGGAGLAVLSLGGRVLSGPQFCHWLAGMQASVGLADLIVTGTTSLSALDRGGAVVQEVAAWAEAAQRPCIAFAGGEELSRREVRTFGLESAHSVPRIDADELSAAAARVAVGWFS